MNEKLNELLTTISDKVNDLTNLEIVTVMGDLEYSEGSYKLKDGQDIQGITSKIDLIDGDIKTHLSETFYKSYPELVQWHQSREAQGNEIIRNNIATIKVLVDTMFDVFKDRK